MRPEGAGEDQLIALEVPCAGLDIGLPPTYTIGAYLMHSLEEFLVDEGIRVQLEEVDLEDEDAVNRTDGDQGAISVGRIPPQVVLEVMGDLDHLSHWELEVADDLFVELVRQPREHRLLDPVYKQAVPAIRQQHYVLVVRRGPNQLQECYLLLAEALQGLYQFQLDRVDVQP